MTIKLVMNVGVVKGNKKEVSLTDISKKNFEGTKQLFSLFALYSFPPSARRATSQPKQSIDTATADRLLRYR
jgi:hypothetical protein